MSKVLNNNFCKMFTKESEFVQLQEEKDETRLWCEIRVNRNEMQKLMKGQEERKTMGPDGCFGTH